MKATQAEFRMPGGNSCTVTVKAPRGVLLSIECQWDNYPPSHADLVMANQAINDWLTDSGINVSPQQINVIDDEHTTERVASAVSRMITAENN